MLRGVTQLFHKSFNPCQKKGFFTSIEAFAHSMHWSLNLFIRGTLFFSGVELGSVVNQLLMFSLCNYALYYTWVMFVKAVSFLSFSKLWFSAHSISALVLKVPLCIMQISLPVMLRVGCSLLGPSHPIFRA